MVAPARTIIIPKSFKTPKSTDPAHQQLIVSSNQLALSLRLNLDDQIRKGELLEWIRHHKSGWVDQVSRIFTNCERSYINPLRFDVNVGVSLRIYSRLSCVFLNHEISKRKLLNENCKVSEEPVLVIWGAFKNLPYGSHLLRQPLLGDRVISNRTHFSQHMWADELAIRLFFQLYVY